MEHDPTTIREAWQVAKEVPGAVAREIGDIPVENLFWLMVYVLAFYWAYVGLKALGEWQERRRQGRHDAD